MLFADDGTWFSVISLAITVIGGGVISVVVSVVKSRHDAELAVLKKDNADLRIDHDECHRRLSQVESSHTASALAFDARIKQLEEDNRRERGIKHELSNYVTVLFGELYEAKVAADKLDDLRKRYLAIMERGRPKTPEG